ncbi:MAG: glycosyltransferase family 2 protein [Pseudomonadota bacterium]
MTSPPPISLCVIAHREEKRIARCLEAARPAVAEMVVVVQEPDDPTIAIAEALGATVHRHPWEGYVAQKNVALAQATQPWVLSLDADEVLDEELALAIAAIDFDRSEGVQAFAARRVDYFIDRWLEHGEPGRQYPTRLFRAGQARWYGGFVHEQLEIDGEGERPRLPGRIRHYSNDSAHDFALKLSRYARLFVAQQVASGRKSPSLAEIWVRANARFIKSYLLRRGFRDGYAGLVHALWLKAYTYERYAGLREYARNPGWREEIDALLASHAEIDSVLLHGLDRLKTPGGKGRKQVG